MTLSESMGEAGCGMTESHSADWLTHTNIYIYMKIDLTFFKLHS